MNDNSAQSSQPGISYVDDYQPPSASTPPVEPVFNDSATVDEPAESDSADKPLVEPAVAEQSIDDDVTEDELVDEQEDDFSDKPLDEPASEQSASVQLDSDNNVSSTVDSPAADKIATSDKSETLEDQNIFFMLGADDGSEELKESFLNELQQVIWDDFLENDVDLLITSDEKVEFDSIMAKKDENDTEEVQDSLVAYLETLIPDLEEIMLEKALDLKADLYVERINGMREYHSSSPENLEKINTAEKLMNEDDWYSSAEVLNGVAAE